MYFERPHIILWYITIKKEFGFGKDLLGIDGESEINQNGYISSSIEENIVCFDIKVANILVLKKL